ncbi:MAG: DUF2939 domain-containing protein [Roseococcus sp.]|nr:DUF2939 domain-containing protein [Roseococcus sp.]
MSASTNSWDDVWAEFDARQAAQAQKDAMVAGATEASTAAANPRRSATSRLQRLIHARRTKTLPVRRSFLESSMDAWSSEAERARQALAQQRQPRKGLGRIKRVVALMACTVIAVYAGSPVASAVQVAAAIQRGDAAALAHYIDWNTLRPALNAALAAETQRHDGAPMPDFITGMASELADRLSSPASLAQLLNQRLAPGMAHPARDMLSRVRMLEAGLWEVTLTSTEVPDRSAKLTLALTDLARLRWEVQAIQLPPQLPARLR